MGKGCVSILKLKRLLSLVHNCDMSTSVQHEHKKMSEHQGEITTTISARNRNIFLFLMVMLIPPVLCLFHKWEVA